MTPIWWPVWTSTRNSTWQFLFQPSVLQLIFFYPSKFATTVFNHFVRPMHWPQKNSPISFSTAHAFVQILQTWHLTSFCVNLCLLPLPPSKQSRGNIYNIYKLRSLFQRGSKKTISRIMKNGPVNPRYQATMSLSTKWFLRNGDLLKEAFIRNPQTFLRVLALRPRHIFKIPCAQNENLANPRCCENFFEGQMISQGCPRKDGNHTIPLQTTSPQKKESKASKCI